ncbi:amino acid adenylation domain-containing protein, partial [Micromonospora sp. DT229]|uniref:amino acid adenylation domain-containing protein n=1 Tax=Micromonospora sp. DT229 TaxID=3393430 RepID=UPI003CF756B9
MDTHPHHTAVIDTDGTPITYTELETWANRVAHHLLAHHIGIEDIIAVPIPRSATLTAAMWGIWKTGAVYLPLDPDYPPHRLHQYTTDAQPTHTLTTHTVNHLRHHTTTNHHRPPTPHTHPLNAAYLIFTSGTTGRPKAAINTHQGLTNRLAWMQHTIPLTTTDRILHKTPTSFDVSLWELTWPLLHAATLVHLPPGAHRDPTTIHHTLTHHHITICHFVPAMLRTYLHHLTTTNPPPTPHLHHVISSGEPLTTDLTTTFHHHHPHTTLHNMYGPTETAIDVTTTTITPHQPITLGHPTPGNHILILNPHHQPQPPNTIGQLTIAGTQLARGYHHQPGHTADTFRPHPTQPGQRIYTTGDHAHTTHNGTIHYHGRTDHQTKIRGTRIELTETHQHLV